MNTYIYLLRHGEVDNPHGILYGRLPGYGLTTRGTKEIEQTAAFLETKNIDLIFASPLLRTRQTAGIIQKKLKLLVVHLSKEIIEIRTSYQGVQMNTLDGVQSQVYLKPQSLTDETIEGMASRMEGFVYKLIKRYPGKRIVFVTHGDPSMSLQAKIMGWPMTFQSVRKGDYIKHGEVWEITQENETKLHLEKVFKPGLSSM